MSRKALTTTFFLVFILSFIVQMLFLNSAFAQMGPVMNPGPDYTPLSIRVINPLKNHVYSPDFELELTIVKPASWFTTGAIVYNYDCQGKVNYIRYSIDGQPAVTFPANDNYTGLSIKPIPASFSYKLPLKGLSQGLHTISVSVEGQYNYWTGSPDYDYTYNTVVGNSSKILFYVNTDQYVWGGSVSSPEDAIPPKITIYSPNSAVVTSNNVSLSFKATNSKDVSVLTDVWYQVAWQKNNASEYHLNDTSSSNLFNDTLTGMSDGNHTITVFASGVGSFVSENTFYVYDIGSCSSVNFAVDSIIPTVSFVDAQNKTYDSVKVVLDFAVNKPVSEILYSLDNGKNVTTNVNTSLILNDLSSGEHNVTVFVVDEYGVVSAPSTTYFDVKVFPTFTVMASVLAVLAVIMVGGLLVYFKKRGRGS